MYTLTIYLDTDDEEKALLARAHILTELTDNVGQHDTVSWSLDDSVVKLDGYDDVSVISIAAECLQCHEGFNPADHNDTIHIERADGTPCGGQGVIVGEVLSLPRSQKGS